MSAAPAAPTAPAAAPAAPPAAPAAASCRGLYFAAYGLTGGAEGASEHRLRRPLPLHLEQARAALLYEALPARSPLRGALRCMTRLGDPRLLRPESVTVGRDPETGVLFCAPPYNPGRSGFRFQWQKPPGIRKTWGKPRHPEGDPPPVRVPGEGVEEAGRYLSYAYLHRYCQDGSLDDYPVYDNASDAPRVFYRATGFSADDRPAVAGLQALMLAHAEHKLTVTASSVAPWQPFARFAQRRLQHHVCQHLVPRLRVLPPLFTSKSRGGARGRHELSLRERVLLPHVLRTCPQRTRRHHALHAVGQRVCARLWDAHASAHPGCLVSVLGRGQGRSQPQAPPKPKPKPKPGGAKTQTLFGFGRGAAARPQVLPPPPTAWRELAYRQRSAAVSALADKALLDWRSIGPALPPALQWRDAHHRGHVRDCCWRGLNVPQVYNCPDADAWRGALRAADRRYLTSPKLLVTNTLPDDWHCFDGVLYCGDGGVTADADGRACLVHWEDETVTHADAEEDGRRRKHRDVYVRVDWMRLDADTYQDARRNEEAARKAARKAAEEKARKAAEESLGEPIPPEPPHTFSPCDDGAARVTTVICVPRAEMPWLSLYVQWFPLLRDDDAPVDARALHPRLVACLDELQAQCEYWIGVCEAELVADAKERGGRKRQLQERKTYFEGLLAQYTALHGFQYAGAHRGAEHHPGPWLVANA